MTTKYTLVQHSAAETHPENFALGVEQASVTDAQAAMVEKAGGLLFEDYMAADDACDTIMYPPDAKGFIPQACGRFGPERIDGRLLFVPAMNMDTAAVAAIKES